MPGTLLCTNKVCSLSDCGMPQTCSLMHSVATVQQAWHGKGPAEDYEMVNYWDTKFPMNVFGTTRDALSSRSALETEPVVEAAEEADSRLSQPQPLRLRRLLLA